MSSNVLTIKCKVTHFIAYTFLFFFFFFRCGVKKVNAIGLNGDSIAESLYEYVIEKPGLILPYGIGLMKMQELRGLTASALDEKFNETTFDSIILTYGPRPFETVQKDVEDFIKLKGFEVPTEYDAMYDYINTLVDQIPSTDDPNYIDPTVPEDKKLNWVPFAIGGGIVVVVGLIGFVIYLKKKEGE